MVCLSVSLVWVWVLAVYLQAPHSVCMYLVLSMFILVVERDERQRDENIYTQGREQQRVLIVGTSIRRMKKNYTVLFVFNIYLLIPFLY